MCSFGTGSNRDLNTIFWLYSGQGYKRATIVNYNMCNSTKLLAIVLGAARRVVDSVGLDCH